MIPELHKEINSLQNEKNESDRKMREQTEQTRGTFWDLFIILVRIVKDNQYPSPKMIKDVMEYRNKIRNILV